MKHLLLSIAMTTMAIPVLSQGTLKCSPECSVKCPPNAVSICEVKDGACTPRCLQVPSALQGAEREAFILSAVLNTSIEVKDLKEEQFQAILREGQFEQGGAKIKFKENK